MAGTRDVADTRLDFLSNEAVTGELLSERLARGRIPAEDALRYAIEIGAALHKVHSKGRVHGALSPFCIALEAGGARILQPSPSPLDAAPYRAPEQVRGETPDVRSDVFAYGALLYEIASGKRAFPGTGVELNQRILTQSPLPLPVRVAASPAMKDVIAGCLEKDPAHRRQRVQNAVTELKLAGRRARPTGETPRRDSVPPAPAAGGPSQAVEPPAPEPERPAPEPERPVPEPERPAPEPERPVPIVTAPRPIVTAARPVVTAYAAQGNGGERPSIFRRRPWVIAGAVLALAATLWGAKLLLQPRKAPLVLKFAVTQPENTTYPGMPSVSPDGRYLAFSAIGPEGMRMLWLRPLDALHATVIQGSEGASAPFWSPDSQEIAFFGNKFLKKVNISGGTPESICGAEASPGGGSWNRDGIILFAPGLSDGFYRVPASGGTAQPALKLDANKSERADLWPQFLPDGNHFVFYQQTDLSETSGVYVGSLDPPEHHRLFNSQTNAVFSASAPDGSKGYLLFINDRNLMALQFNASRLEAAPEPVTLANDIGALSSLALAPVSVSATGVLVYQGVGQPTRQMVWMDRGGRQLSVGGTPGLWGPPRISPDGKRAIVAKAASDNGIAHLWLLDVSGAAEQMTDGPMHEGSPIWSPDGSRIAHFGRQDVAYDIFVRAAQVGSKPELLLKTVDQKFPTDWSRDGRYVIFTIQGVGTHFDIWGYSLGERRAAPILDTMFSEAFATVSPDGKWLAYQSDQTGHNEVYVQAFDGLNNGTKRRWMISKGGGGLPRWRSDGGEMLYMTADGRVMSAAIHLDSDSGIESDPPRMLFQTRPVPNQGWNLYDVTPDGQRFSLNIPLEWTSAAPITVVTNWAEKLRD